MGYDDYDYDNVEYRPAKPKKPLPKTPRARAAAMRRLTEARAKYNDFVRQVGTTKQFNQRMKTANLRRLGQMDLDDFMNFSRGSGAMEKFNKNLKK
jgi:hypothetical protein